MLSIHTGRLRPQAAMLIDSNVQVRVLIDGGRKTCRADQLQIGDVLEAKGVVTKIDRYQPRPSRVNRSASSGRE